ncbi:MAG: DUF4424 family protein [Rhizomicrobium sp.]|nr:DUF4424 family protein [Rhizomicrobium sp.]
MRKVMLAALGALAMVPAAADDSTAALQAGSIVFTKNTPVVMTAEDLYLSPNRVGIRFVFANPAKTDVATLVAFPLPDIDTAEFWGSGAGAMTADPQNFVGFKAVVDGKPVAFRIEQRAFVKGKEVTAELAAAGAVLNPLVDDGFQKLDKIALVKLRALAKAGIVALDETPESDAKGKTTPHVDVIPQWTVTTRFYWPQTFPAGKSVVIEHSYQPVTGASLFSTDSDKQHQKYYDVDYCFDQPSWAGLKRRTAAAQKKETNYLTAYRTDYILKTAGNWQGPIGRFHLTLDKLKAENILSLCWDGALKKTGATTFEFTQEHFAPARDIRMVVLEAIP